MEVLAKADEYGTGVPTNIAPGPFLQLAADNTDINEETLDGKNTTHATSMVVFQRRPYGPEPPPVQLANHSDRRRSLQAGGRIYELQECSALGRRPQVTFYTGQVKQEWFKGENELLESARCADEVWKVMRLHPSSLTESQSREVIASQSVPGWSAYNAMLYPELPQISMVGYCPLIDGSSKEFSTIYTVLKHAQAISNSIGQEDTVITLDLAIYVKGKQIQWRFADEFSDVVIRMGTFHIALNFLAIIGKKYLNSGIEDLLIEAGVYAAGTTSILMKGKSYNRGVRAHKLCMEAFFRLMWPEFVKWYNHSDSREQGRLISEGELRARISSSVAVVEKQENIPEVFPKLEEDLSDFLCALDVFKSEARGKSRMFSLWEEYCSMVDIVLQLIKAEKTGNWDLHLSAVAAMTPHFFAMDIPNYSRWLPVYFIDMHRLESTHPRVHQAFLSGEHSISRSAQPFSQVSTDMALEQSINADSKAKGGIIGISQTQSALDRWFLTIHERASVTTTIKDVY